MQFPWNRTSKLVDKRVYTITDANSCENYGEAKEENIDAILKTIFRIKPEEC